MQVETVQMDPRVARIKWRDYRDKVREHREARQKKLDALGKKAGRELGRVRIEKTKIEKEDEELKRLYYQLSKGQTVLHLPKVIGAAGLNKDKLPRLAVCRADFEWCRFDTGSGEVYFYEWGSWSHNKTNTITVQSRFFVDNGYAELNDYGWRSKNNLPTLSSVRALVPTIPPHLRPGDELSKYYILWEAEWKKQPPSDPILLTKVTQDIFIVVAQWDLTPVEQLVLEGRIG
jgi:hypothetical protein